MSELDADVCINEFSKLCDDIVQVGLISAEECQFWVFARGFQAKDASVKTFSRLCDEAETSDLVSTIDCQYWLFEQGYHAAKKVANDKQLLNRKAKPSSVNLIYS